VAVVDGTLKLADSTASTLVCKHIGHINCDEPELALISGL
jgi:hypothetical protein